MEYSKEEERELVEMLARQKVDSGEHLVELDQSDLERIHELRFALTSERVEAIVRDLFRSESEESVDKLLGYIFRDY